MKTPPTIPAPLPTDHRLLSLARLLNVPKRDALAATVEAWAWIQAQATEGIVPSPIVLLDGVAEIEGYGEAAVAVGLVGTADGHIVAPVELRQADTQGTARRAGTADDDARERERRQARERQRRRRIGSRLTGKPKPTTPSEPAPAAATTPSRKARRLGTLPGGYDVLLIPKRDGEWFYKVPGSVPDLTGTVTDANTATLADALKALLNARLTQTQQAKGKLGTPTFSPSMEQLVEAARREQADRQAAAVAAARVDEGNVALAQAAAVDADQDDAEQVAPTADMEPDHAPGDRSTSSPDGPAERDCHAHVTHVTRDKRDKRDCHVSVTVAPDAKPLPGSGLDAVFCHASVTLAAPSSSSSSFYAENENENTTTTRATADHQRDAGVAEQNDIFDRYLKAWPRRPVLDRETAALVQRLADALGSSPEAIREQGRNHRDVLLARCRAAGIDPKTGFPVADAQAGGHAPTSPQDAPESPSSDGTSVQAQTTVQAADGSVAAPAATPPATGSPPGSGQGSPASSRQRDHAADGRDRDDNSPIVRCDADAEMERRRREVMKTLSASGA
jgi:hypothetical protein